MPLELQRSYIPLLKAQINSKKMQQSKLEKLHPQCVKTGSNENVPLLVRASLCTLDRDFPIFVPAFNQNCFGLSKEVCNFFVAQGT